MPQFLRTLTVRGLYDTPGLFTRRTRSRCWVSMRCRSAKGLHWRTRDGLQHAPSKLTPWAWAAVLRGLRARHRGPNSMREVSQSSRYDLPLPRENQGFSTPHKNCASACNTPQRGCEGPHERARCLGECQSQSHLPCSNQMKTKASFSSPMHWMKRKTSVLGLTLLTLSATNASAVVTPDRMTNSNIVYEPTIVGVTGIVRRFEGGRAVSVSSAAVVSHPKVLLTCAHASYKNGLWVPAATLSFTAAHHAAGLPAAGIAPRGYFKFSGYASANNKGGMTLPALNMDMVAAYAYTNFAGGRYAGYWSSGATTVLTSNKYWKKCIGYPGAHFGNYFMYCCGPFIVPTQQVYGAYYKATGATTYGGNSGGPVFGYDQAGQNWYVAGVQLSSDNSTWMGIRALDADGIKMLNAARASVR